MRKFNTQITKQFAIGQNQGCIAIATGHEHHAGAAQHLGLRHADRLRASRRACRLWHGLRASLAANLRNAWQTCTQFTDAAAAALAAQPAKPSSYRLSKSAMYGMSVAGLLPVAVRRLPVAIATGMPMPRSADC
ncbi:MAG TPA: hypothetical protein VMF30_08410 [Pirellulales bacterium]|nr:hypothetical protein [Pirellulales bacterium]